MITPHPSVQRDTRHARRMVHYGTTEARNDKRAANRRYRRVLNQMTRGFELDSDRFDDEPFDAPSFSGWDIA